MSTIDIAFYIYKKTFYKSNTSIFKQLDNDSATSLVKFKKKTLLSELLRTVWGHEDIEWNRWADLERNVRKSRPLAVHLQ